MATIDQDDATRVFRAPLVVLALLTLVAGFGDGFSLSRFGVFVANQSGNIVHVGMGLVGQDPSWTMSLASVAGFAVGGATSWLVTRRASSGHAPTVRIRLVLGSALVAAWWVALITITSSDVAGLASAFIGAAAMGVFATALTRVAGLRAQTSFQSGTVLQSAQSLMKWATSRASSGNPDRQLVLIGLITVTSYAAGGALGAFVQANVRAAAVALVLLPVAGAFALVQRARDGAPG